MNKRNDLLLKSMVTVNVISTTFSHVLIERLMVNYLHSFNKIVSVPESELTTARSSR
jgi:hypothetical protein